MGWLSGYSSKRSKVINGSSAGAQTDYQKRIVLHYDTAHQLTGWVKDTVNNPLLDPAGMTQCWPAMAYSGGITFMFLGAPFSGTDGRLWTANDGINFTEHGNSPVIVRGAGGTWDDDMIEPHSVVWETAAMAAARYNGGGGEGGADPCWRLYYGGYKASTGWSIGYAWSTDLVAWDKYDSNPVISPEGDELTCADPHAVIYDDKIFIYYATFSGGNNIWVQRGAWSNDGHTFTKFTDIIKYGAIPGAFYPFANGIAGIWNYLDGTGYRAVWSTDGEHFVEYSENPILTPGAGGQWDDEVISHCDIIKVGSTYWLYYAAYNGTVWQIGRASTTSDDEGADIPLLGDGRTDFGDARFTKSDEETELPYWIERKVDSQFAEVHIKIDSIPASPGSYTIYVYCGKADATTTSNIKNASYSSQGDDFGDNSRDAAIWDLISAGTGAGNEANQRLEIAVPANGDIGGYVSKNILDITNVLMRILAHNPTVNLVEIGFALTKTTESIALSQDNAYRITLYQHAGADDCYVSRKVATVFSTRASDDWLGSEVELIIKITGGTIKFFEGSQAYEFHSEAYALGSYDAYIYLGGEGVTGDLGTDWIDTFWIQKYVSPEPVWGATGEAQFHQTLELTGISSVETFGTTSVIGVSILLPDAIPSSEAFGTQELVPGVVALGPIAISSEESLGTAKLVPVISPTGIISSEVFGSSMIVCTIKPNGVVSVETFGLSSVVGSVFIFPEGVGSLEAFGTTLIGLFLNPSAIPTGEGFGTTKVNLNLAPSGIGTLEALGSPTLHLIIFPTSAVSAEAFGTATLAPGLITIDLIGDGIASVEAFGTTNVGWRLTATGIASLEAFGTPSLIGLGVLQPDAIPSGEAFGTAVIQLALQIVLPSAIGSGETFGAASVVGLFVVTPDAIISEEAFGTAELVFYLLPGSIPTAEAFGTQKLSLWLSPSGIATGEGFGTALLGSVLSLEGIASVEAFGTAALEYIIAAGGLGSLEAFGVPTFELFVIAEGIASDETFGLTTVIVGLAIIAPDGIVSEEAFGAVRLTWQQFILLTGITSTEAFGTHVVFLHVAGRLLAVITFTRPYRQLQTYTRSYRDLKTYTSEVKI